MSVKRRLEKLEAARRAWRASHVPRAELLAFVRDMLGVVGVEAGEATAARVGWRVVAQRAGEVLAQVEREGRYER